MNRRAQGLILILVLVFVLVLECSSWPHCTALAVEAPHEPAPENIQHPTSNIQHPMSNRAG